MGKFDALLWDVDGTLLNFLYSQRIAISRCLAGIGVDPSEEMIQRYSVINDGYWKRLEKVGIRAKVFSPIAPVISSYYNWSKFLRVANAD